jgi:hypothetical protein
LVISNEVAAEVGFGHHFQRILYMHSDIPNADLQKMFTNKIKRVQACIDARGNNFQHLL